eukprot:6476246-Amphidinium_carterae.4
MYDFRDTEHTLGFRGVIKDCLCIHQSYTSVLGSRMGPQHWLDSYRGIASLVLPLSAVDAVLGLKESESFSRVSKELATLVAGSNLGAKLFGWATQSIMDAEILGIVKAEISKLGKRSKLTEGVFVEAVAAAHERVLALGVTKSSLEKKREVEIYYGDWCLHMPVSCVDEEIQLHFRSALRCWAVSLGLLTPLPAEKELIAGAQNIEVAVIEKELLAKAETARCTALKLIAGEDGSGLTAEIILDRAAVQ